MLSRPTQCRSLVWRGHAAPQVPADTGAPAPLRCHAWLAGWWAAGVLARACGGDPCAGLHQPGLAVRRYGVCACRRCVFLLLPQLCVFVAMHPSAYQLSHPPCRPRSAGAAGPRCCNALPLSDACGPRLVLGGSCPEDRRVLCPVPYSMRACMQAPRCWRKSLMLRAATRSPACCCPTTGRTWESTLSCRSGPQAHATGPVIAGDAPAPRPRLHALNPSWSSRSASVSPTPLLCYQALSSQAKLMKMPAWPVCVRVRVCVCVHPPGHPRRARVHRGPLHLLHVQPRAQAHTKDPRAQRQQQ